MKAPSFGGSVSDTLEDDLRRSVRTHGIVVWLDQAGHRTAFVDRLNQAREAGALSYEVRAFRGSHLALMRALDGLAAGTEKVPLVLHLPGSGFCRTDASWSEQNRRGSPSSIRQLSTPSRPSSSKGRALSPRGSSRSLSVRRPLGSPPSSTGA